MPNTSEHEPCPCGSSQVYGNCCGLYHSGPLFLQAIDPETLMRSRYSAYVLGLQDYLLATWHSSTRPALLTPDPPGLRWLGLQIKAARMIDADHGTVEFVARSKLAGRAHRLHEISEFIREAGRWTYLRGDIQGR